MIRKTITRACLVSMLTVAPASQVSALQSFGQLDAPAAAQYPAAVTPERSGSILEPVMPKEFTLTQTKPAPAMDEREEAIASYDATFANGMFAELEAMVAASLQEDTERAAEGSADAVNAHFELTDNEILSYRVSQVTALLPDRKSRIMSSAEAESAILIHPPETRPTAPNRHYFKIENTSTKNAENIVVEMVVPSHVHIIEVFPYETIVAGKTARYKIDSIGAGDSVTVELTTNPSVKEEIIFESRFSLEHVRHLAARSKPHKVDVWSAEKKPAPAPVPTPVPNPRQATKVEQPKKVSARKVSSEPKTNVLSGDETRQKWKDQARLSYGKTGIPGKVMVANPQTMENKLPVAATPNAATPVAATPKADQAEAPHVSVLEGKSSNTPSGVLVESRPITSGDGVSPDVSAVSTKSENGWFQSQLKTKIDGPQHAVKGEEAEYQVYIENASAEDVEEVLVQLAIPTGIEVTVIDRDAWFDGKARTITWKVPKVAAGAKETIRYLAKMVSSDGHLQKVTLGVANQFRGQAIFQSTVLDQYELAAPLLPFEKDSRSLK